LQGMINLFHNAHIFNKLIIDNVLITNK